jgi:hypothetical protein
MTDDQKQKLVGIVASTFEIPAAQVSEQMTIGSIPQWDSLGHLGLISAIEEGFGVSFDVDELFEVESLADFISLLDREGD